MKRKRKGTSSQQTVTSYCLPDDGWESIFKIIIADDNNSRRCLNSLSLVSKRFLSITNRVILSFTVRHNTDLSVLFKRFTNLNSLELNRFYVDFLIKIFCFPLKLTSLYLSYYSTIPADGLRAFSQKITTLTSLTCYRIRSLNASDLFLIAECFPLLQELHLEIDTSYPWVSENYSSYVGGVEALSLALIKLRKVNLSRFPINDQSLFHLFNNCKHLEEVVLFRCDEITDEGFAFALRERPTLTSLSFSFSHTNPKDKRVFSTSHFIDSLVSLKGLTCLVLNSLNITDELLYSIAREVLPLTRLDLQFCTNYSYNGILCLLSNCRRIKYLNLESTACFLEDEHVVQLSSLLRHLVSIDLSGCPMLTQSALFTLAKNCPSLSEIKMDRIGSNSLQNSDSFVEFGVRLQLKSLYLGHDSWLSDESIIMFASVFPDLQLFDLNHCNRIGL